jgi:DNA-binding response OmpR family regulator
MISTGVEALDSRLGGVARDGFFLVLGQGGVGKSMLGAHFLGTGLDRRERCLLVTTDPADEIDGRGLFTGFSPGPLSAHPCLERLDPGAAGHDPGGAPGGSQRHPAVHDLARALARAPEDGAGPVSRIVIDDLADLLRGSHSPRAAAGALIELLGRSGAAAYVLADSGDAAAVDSGVLDLLAESAAVVVRLEQTGRGRRRITFPSVRQPAFSTEPFLYTLRAGGGFAEDLPAYDHEVEEPLRRRIVIFDEVGALPDEVVAGLEAEYDVKRFTNLSESLPRLLEARYGVLVLGTDPYDPERAFNVAYSLRKAGNGAPILFVSPSRGLRSMTRARALRIGGDDFLIAELPPREIVERITSAARRGHHRRNGSVRADRPLQPRSADGDLRPMTADELTRAMAGLIAETPTPFFVLAVLGDGEPGAPWDAVRGSIRLSDGDLLAALPDGRLAVVLTQVDLALAERVLGRLRAAHPALDGTRASLLASPLQGDELRRWIAEVELGGAPV